MRRIDAGQRRVDRAFERAPHRLGLARLGHDREHRRRAEQRGNGDGDGVRGHRVDVGEVALAHLLATARVVELHHLDVERVVEVGDGRVVEREVPVLADAEAAEVERMVAEQRGVPLALGVGVGGVARR